jgi:hypothetical protein
MPGEVPELFRRCEPAEAQEMDDSDVEIVDEGPACGKQAAATLVV